MVNIIAFIIAAVILVAIIGLIVAINLQPSTPSVEDLRVQAALKAYQIQEYEHAAQEAIRAASRQAFEQMVQAAQPNRWGR